MDIKELNRKEMGNKIRACREELDMTREQLAERIDVSSKFIADIEYGDKGISLKKFYLLSQIFSVSTDYLLGNCEMVSIEMKLRIVSTRKGGGD